VLDGQEGEAVSDLSPFEKVHTYMRGWYCGAGVKTIDERLAEHPRKEIRELWDEGYEAGLRARTTVAKRICRRFKYKPNPLRLDAS
jgi:hypothetical protein